MNQGYRQPRFDPYTGQSLILTAPSPSIIPGVPMYMPAPTFPFGPPQQCAPSHQLPILNHQFGIPTNQSVGPSTAAVGLLILNHQFGIPTNQSLGLSTAAVGPPEG
jgi:hypothetical protein